MKGKGSCKGVGGRHLFFYVAVIVILIASIIMLIACDDTDTMSAGNDNASNVTDNNVSNGDVENNNDNNNADDNTPNNGDTPSDDKDNNSSDNNGKDDDKSDDDNKQDEMKEMSIEVKDAFFIYDGLYHGISIEGIPEGANIDYYGESEYKNAGIYEIKAKITLEGYKDKVITARLEIAKRKLEEDSISFDDVTCVWDGEEHGIEVAGEIPADITVAYINNGQSDVGEYEIIATFDTHGNYEDIAEMKAILRINEKLYNIRFVEYNGKETVIQVGHGKALANLPIPGPRSGYTVKWEDKDLSEITENKVVYAEYSPITYAITYKTNGGLNDMRNVEEYTVEDGEFELYEPFREGYTFVCWRDEDWNAISKISAEWLRDIEVYAEWEAIEYGISYVLNGGDNDERNAESYTVEDEEVILYDAHRDGYIFCGWYNDADCIGERITEICTLWKKRMVLYAKWNLEEYEIRYILNGGDNDERNATSYTIEDDDIILYDASREYYIFCGWYEDVDCNGERATKISGDLKRTVTLYAEWESVYEIRNGEIIGYNYSYSKDVVIPYEIDGEKIVGIASGVLQEARRVEVRAELSEIGEDMFAGCVLLEELDMGSSIGSIADGALRDCSSLITLTVPYIGLREKGAEDGTYYPLAALFGEQERDGYYEASMTSMMVTGGMEDYDFTTNRKRYIPNTLKEITVLSGTVLGYGLEGLESVEKVSVHGDNILRFAFRNCACLQELRILGEVEELNNTALMGCEALRIVYVESKSVRELVLAAIEKVGLTNVQVVILE